MEIRLNFGKMNGLVPAVVQDITTGMIRMIGFVNREALNLTLSTGLVHFYSRTRREIWMKGKTSGNILKVVDIVADCDGDCLLIKAIPMGPTCHTGAPSCFYNTLYSGREELFRKLVEEAFKQSVIQIREYVGEDSRKYYLYIVNPFTDNIPPPNPLLVSLTVDKVLSTVKMEKADKVVVPEALGLPFASTIALRAGKPLAVVRKRRYQLPGEIAVEYTSGYERGVYYIYGLEKGEKVVLVDDAISTGGTLIAVIKALKPHGVEILDAVSVISKPQYGGEEKVLAETGIMVKSVLKVFVEENGRLRVEDSEGKWRFELIRPILDARGSS